MQSIIMHNIYLYNFMSLSRMSQDQCESFDENLWQRFVQNERVKQIN